MIVDPAVIPGLLLLATEIAVLAAVGFIVVRVALRQTDDRMALAQGMVVGPALWGLLTNVALYAAPGMAGAAVGWGVVLALGAVLLWRAPERIRPRPRVLAGFVVVVLVLLWVGLASRQLLETPDPQVRLGLPPTLRAGVFPPVLPWNPDLPLRYHYGIDLLTGLLAPPVGPDTAFLSELLGVYAWVTFVLVVLTALIARGSWRVALFLAPFLLATGLWTWKSWSPGILQAPVPTGLPEAGVRASLAELYWPPVGDPFRWGEIAIPDIWKPSYTLAYSLLFVVLERASQGAGRSWPAVLVLGGLVGFLGLLAMTLTPLALALWAGLEAVRLGRRWRAQGVAWRAVAPPGAGLALAVVLLLTGGGRFTGLLDGSASSGLVFWWDGEPRDWQLLGVLETRPGGVGLMGVGPVVLAGIAALLARRDRLVLALALGAGTMAVAWLVLRWEPKPIDLDRLTGHARNLAMLALLLALSARLAGLRTWWRYAVGTLLLGLVIWPTVIGPVRHLALALGQGIELANAASVQRPPGEEPKWGRGRFAMPPVSPRIVAYIRDHTATDARVLAPESPRLAVVFATGRPNGAGFMNIQHFVYFRGPEFLDARDHLEPGAMRRLGIDYVYATDEWLMDLSERGARWLADPELFELLVRDGAEALYRVRPAFTQLDVPPTPASFEALRQAVPPGTSLYSPSGTSFDKDTVLRVASVLLPEAQFLGELRFEGNRLHAITRVPSEPLDGQTPDLVLLPVQLEPRMFPPEHQQPIWWNHETAIYAPNGAVDPIMPPPPDAAPPEPSPVKVRIADVQASDARIAFTLTVEDHSPDRWTGQDWVVTRVDESPWAIPTNLKDNKPVIEQWFEGQVFRARGTTTRDYVFDAETSSLALRDADGGETAVTSSSGEIRRGAWTLSLRLLREEDRGTFIAQEEAAFIPVLKITVSAAGDVSFSVFDNVLGR